MEVVILKGCGGDVMCGQVVAESERAYHVSRVSIQVFPSKEFCMFLSQCIFSLRGYVILEGLEHHKLKIL
jgi:hypothetical protein